MDIHQSTASNLVKTLVDRGLVATQATGHAARAADVLPAGARVLRDAPGPFAGVLPDALGSLDPRTLKRLEADLTKLIAILRIDDAAGSIPLAEL